ncbi:MAG: hypothetical protein ACLP01_09010 [Solirubrobacteraceae bacterium]
MLAVLLVGAWSTALASASTRSFLVQYSGTGTYKFTQETQDSPECGEVFNHLTENTSFSWFTTYDLSIDVLSAGVRSEGAQTIALEDHDQDNEATLDGVATGCQSGNWDCHGEVSPHSGDATLSAFGAANGASAKFTLEAVPKDGFDGDDYGGQWSGDIGPFSCDEYNGLPVLQGIFENPDLDGETGPLFTASFPVKAATWISLPRGHYFKVDISPGHYAPKPETVCFASDGCDHESLDWSGVVKVRRYR